MATEGKGLQWEGWLLRESGCRVRGGNRRKETPIVWVETEVSGLTVDGLQLRERGYN